MGLAAILWLTNTSLIIHGESFSTHSADELKRYQIMPFTRYHSGKDMLPNTLDLAYSHCLDPLCMDSGSAHRGERGLQLTRPYDYKRNIRLHLDYRLCLASLDAHRLASPTLSWCGHRWSWTPTLETGVVLAVLVSPLFSPSANVISVRQGLIWLLIATLAEVPPVVRPTGS
jgi:hypothetical protein